MSLAPEEQGRADFYGLLARLFYAPPDAALLAALASADALPAVDDALARAWRELSGAAAAADAEAVRDEYETAFIGTGRAPVTLYTSAYSIKYSNETPLAALREELARLGLARRSEAVEPEDHIAALCESMRHLVAEQQRDLVEQRHFFERWLHPGAAPLCTAVEASEHTAFYKRVAALAKSFFSLEQSAFEML